MKRLLTVFLTLALAGALGGCGANYPTIVMPQSSAPSSAAREDTAEDEDAKNPETGADRDESAPQPERSSEPESAAPEPAAVEN